MASTKATKQETPAPDPLGILLAGDSEAIEALATEADVGVVEWIRGTLIDALEARDPRATGDEEIERKLRALVEASGHSYPTADIEDMLRETEAGRWVRW